MLGNPKYNIGDEVTFSIMNRKGVECDFTGNIVIIDRYGTFENNTDVSYDILVKNVDNNCILYKHVIESSIINKNP